MLQTGVGYSSETGYSGSRLGPSLLVEGKAFANAEGKPTTGLGMIVHAEIAADRLYKGASFFIRF